MIPTPVQLERTIEMLRAKARRPKTLSAYDTAMGYWHDFCGAYGLDPTIPIAAADYHNPEFFDLSLHLQQFVAYLSLVVTPTGTLHHKTIVGHLNGLAKVTKLTLGVDILATQPTYKWLLNGVRLMDIEKGVVTHAEAPMQAMLLQLGDRLMIHSGTTMRAVLWLSVEILLRISEAVPTSSHHSPLRSGLRFVRNDDHAICGMSLLIPSSKGNPLPATRRIVLKGRIIAPCVRCRKPQEQTLNPVTPADFLCWRCTAVPPNLPLFGTDTEETLLVYEMARHGMPPSHCISEMLNYLEEHPNLNPEGPLFPGVTPDMTICTIRSIVKGLGLNPTLFGNQSCRRGGTCDLVLQRFSDAQISTFGRWKGDCWKECYAAMAFATLTTGEHNQHETVPVKTDPTWR